MSIPEWSARLALACLTVALICLLVAAVQRSSTARPGGDTSASSAESSPPSAADAIVFDLSKLTPFADRETPWWSWLPLGALAAVATLAGYRLTRRDFLEPQYVREPEDSQRFQEAIRRCINLLPANPRDAIRTVNLMRMEYLVQAAEAAADAEQKRPNAIPKLDEWECVTYTLLQQRHGAFRPEVAKAFRDAPSTNGASRVVADVYRDAVSKVAGLDAAAVSADIAVLEKGGGVVQHLTDPAKIRRFVDVNWFTLDVGWKAESPPAPPKT